jgi:murein DD-endopeptidase MepM/ murein hydrolase activator NlpD
MKRRRRKAPVSTLRARLSERVRENDDWGRYEPDDFDRPAGAPFFMFSFLGRMHRYLPVKIAAALVVILLAALLSRGGAAWSGPVVEALRYTATRNVDFRGLTEAVPAFRATWENWQIPSLKPGEQPAEARLPLDGRLVGGFGLREPDRMCYGIDLAAPAGTPVRAVLAGRVGEITRQQDLFTVLIDHDGGWQTLYRGLDAAALQEGSLLSRGGLLGALADDPVSGTPRLYFELRWQGRPVPPPDEWVAQFAGWAF